MPIDDDRIAAVATDLAFMEMIRLILGEAFFTPDQTEFRRRMEAFENAAVSALSTRKHFPALDDVTNQRISEEASALVTKIMTSINHPGDPRPVGA
jgi:hypothetical protein